MTSCSTSFSRGSVLRWHWLARRPYASVLAEQVAARERVWAGEPGVILLCEHPPVVTLGRSANRANVLTPGDVPVVQTDRGGCVTYHGPGQLMIYPIVRVTTVVGLLSAVAGALAQAVGAIGVRGAAFRRDPAGLWIGDAKLAACGIHLARGVSIHGWALDVSTPASAWQMIRPCGLAVPQISVSQAAGRAISVEEIAVEVGPRIARALL